MSYMPLDLLDYRRGVKGNIFSGAISQCRRIDSDINEC